jgi:purine-binding chemotaxis protein CheW
MDLQLVLFKLGKESFGVEIATVESIIKMQPITRLPKAPKFIEGVTNLRGKIIPVIDLRKRLGVPATEANSESRIVVVNLDGATVGMVVDSVEEVMHISEDTIEPPPAITISVAAHFIRGIAKTGSELVILLDLFKVLDTSETVALGNLAVTA